MTLHTFDHEVACIGAGSANLAVAAALEDLAPAVARRTVMFEAAAEIAWQPGLLVPGSLSQVSFLKDLATLRDPASRFTFLAYLKATGQLDDFLNMGTALPFREEVSRYHRWASEQLEAVDLRLATPVRAVTPIHEGAGIVGWRIETDRGIDTARHVVCGVGRDARVPSVLRDVAPERVIHSTRFTDRIEAWTGREVSRIAIVGGAQSAAELALVSGELFPRAERTMIMRSIGLTAYEISKFTNELFYPGFIDTFHAMDEEQRASVLAQMHRANYAGVAPHTLEALYAQRYLGRLEGRERIAFRTMTEIEDAARLEDGRVRLSLRSRVEGATTLDADLVLLGTGFEPRMPAFVRALAEAAGVAEIEVGRDYRLRTGEADEGLCFVLGVNERSHGIADSLLSVQAPRAREVADVLAAASRRDAVRAAAAATRPALVPASPEGFIKRLDESRLVHENGLDAQRLLPCPLVTPFEASWCVIRPGSASTPHGHHEAEIFVAVEGEATLEAYGRTEVFRKGDTAFFRPGVPHRVVNDGASDFVMYSIWWDDAMSLRQLEQFREPPRRIA